MYAIVETGGKQYRVSQGETIIVEKVDAGVGDTVTLDKVLFVNTGNGVKVGAPTVDGARVVARVVEHGRDKKIVIFKYKAKKNYHKKQGHRQPYSKLTIESIEV